MEQFDATSALSNDYLAIEWQRKHPLPLMTDILSGHTQIQSLLEVGFATGEFYRYLTHRLPAVMYTGADVSEVAYEIVKKRYLEGNFLLTNIVQPDFVDGKKFDFVFSRGVVHHTGAPYASLQNMYGAA